VAVVIPSGRTHVVQTLDGGIVEELLVKEGDTVQPGQTLLRMNRAQAEPAYLETLSRITALRGNLARLRSELHIGSIGAKSKPSNFPNLDENQRLLQTRRQQAIQQEIQMLEKSLLLAQEELRMTEPLLATGDVSRVDVLRLQRQVVELQAQMSNRRNSYFKDSMSELTRTEEELTALEQTLNQRKSALERADIKTPVAGVVKNIRVTTNSAVLRSADEIMHIVPSDDALVLEAKVKPSDIGFVKVGMPVSVKVDTYDYTIYGTLPGVVTLVGPDSVREDSPNREEFFRVRVRVSSQNVLNHGGRNYPITVGMSAIAEIKTGQRSVMSFLTKPLTKTLNESMGER
jgi:adhesin transport system membrane fusion protein